MEKIIDKAKKILNNYGMLFALILLVLVSSLISDSFFTVRNIYNVLSQAAIIGIIAIGQTYVILTQGIDLSVGAILALSLIFIAGLMGPFGVVLAMLVGIVVSVLAGLINGLGITYGKLPPFIMTLGLLSVARGIIFIYSGGTPIPILNNAVYSISGTPLGVPNEIIIYFGLVFIFGFILYKTPFGRSLYAIGSNEEAAQLSGVPVTRYKMITYMISGLCAGLASIIFASRMGVGTPVAGQGLNLDSIAAVVIGGTALSGGKGTLIGTVIGTLIIGVLSNILNLTGVNPFLQRLVKGALIVVAVMVMQGSSN